ncbi:MAG: hypothetical protein IPK16_11380 [Anaerolineales bacterium]|nr:hypothetical protein [Anaerolineales bacterium]
MARRARVYTCEGYTDYHTWADFRMGAGFYGQGLISGNVFEDLFSTGNAGLGFSAAKPFGVGVTDGVIDHATIFGNGLDAPVVDGGIGAEVNDDQLDPFTITNTYIEGTSYQGQGARLQNRYVDGVLTATSLWPWPMESRALDELGISITDLMVNRYDVLSPPTNGVTPTPATTTPSATPTNTPTSTPTKTAVPPTNTPTKTPVPSTATPTPRRQRRPRTRRPRPQLLRHRQPAIG